MAKPAPLQSSTIARAKGGAVPATDSTARGGAAPADAAPVTLRSLSFRVPEDLFYRFNDIAHAARISNVELFHRAMRAYEQANPPASK